MTHAAYENLPTAAISLALASSTVTGIRVMWAITPLVPRRRRGTSGVISNYRRGVISNYRR